MTIPDSDDRPWILSPSPHVHEGSSVRGLMREVLIALVPAVAVAVFRNGLDAVRLIFVCVSVAVLGEAAARFAMRRTLSVQDLSAAVTGLLLALNLPPGLPSWMAALGSLVAVVIAKQVFGGLGYNIFNPALVGRVVLLISFPVAMTTWAPPDAVTTATPLAAWKTAWAAGAPPPAFADIYPLRDLFLGLRNGGLGSLGEVSEAALLLGGLYLLARRVIGWEIPFLFIGTVALLASLFYALDPARNLPPLTHLATGGLFLGAFFMATDYVTSPVTRPGQMLFAIGCGVITFIIRRFGGYPEGVSFAILIMNGAAPLLDRLTIPRPYGHRRRTSS